LRAPSTRPPRLAASAPRSSPPHVGAEYPVMAVDLASRGETELAVWLRKHPRSGTVSTRDTSTRVFSGAPRVRLACLACPLGPRKGCRDPDLAPPGGRAPAPDRDAEAVLGRPRGPGCAARLLPSGHLRQLRVIISPRTLLRWHADLVRRRWAYPRRASGRPRTAQAIRTLVLEMERDNPSWGYRRITASCLALAIRSRRRRCGRSSRTRASTLHPGAPVKPGGSSWPGMPPRSSRRTSSTSILCSCAACTSCFSSSTAPAACTWPGSPPHTPAHG
jgi:hypothetical protein